jgi:hypothetical protein
MVCDKQKQSSSHRWRPIRHQSTSQPVAAAAARRATNTNNNNNNNNNGAVKISNTNNDSSRVGMFGVVGLHTPADFEEIATDIRRRCEKLRRQYISQPISVNTVRLMDQVDTFRLYHTPTPTLYIDDMTVANRYQTNYVVGLMWLSYVEVCTHHRNGVKQPHQCLMI